MSDTEGGITYCNSRKKGMGDRLEKREPGPEHAGEGYCAQHTDGSRCRMHGKHAGRPVKHGLHSTLRDDLREHVERALETDAPGSLEGELAVLRGLLYDFLEDKESLSKSEIEAARSLLQECRRTVQTAHKMEMDRRPTQQEIKRLVKGMGSILRRFVPEGDREEALAELRSLTATETA